MENVTEEPVSLYKEIEPLTDKPNGPVLVRNRETKEFFVKKCYPLFLKENLLTLQALDHTHLPKIQEVLIEDGKLFLYEEFIHGKTLTQIIQRSEMIEIEALLKMTLELLDALIALHSKGIIHRDVKPGNIMMTNDGVLKLIDFDAVRTFDGGKETDTVQLGTVGFASPEQFGFAESDRRSDLYSVGVVMNVCATKKYPKEQLSTNKFLRPLILKATKLDPNDRYQSALEMKREVEEQWKKLKFNQLSDEKVENKVSQEDRIREILAKNAANKEQQQNIPQKVAKTYPSSIVRKYVPGFRTDIVWKKVIAVVYYLFIVIFVPQDISEKQSFNAQLAVTLEDIIVFILPIFLFTNFMNFHAKLPLLKSEKLTSRILGYVLLSFVWIFLCVVAVNMLKTQ
ncbi:MULTISPECIES: serine/threonine-protein kinase [unclassified Enterococcus]|uniref:serine/threonine-protein kinase n=1 Tax=unclassified Enterococcus TaxID=2608891 RepID=UPI001CE05770|nr:MULTISPECIES: serine/threonine-protein kinase [unclassified Enterococcus]MCA5013329.1 serine/threonine protein kinase [Enterococcus sp. S23]MCA5016579.1 serine/threonine protein kinase [Enterococcus sp. S22(2020)]